MAILFRKKSEARNRRTDGRFCNTYRGPHNNKVHTAVNWGTERLLPALISNLVRYILIF